MNRDVSLRPLGASLQRLRKKPRRVYTIRTIPPATHSWLPFVVVLQSIGVEAVAVSLFLAACLLIKEITVKNGCRARLDDRQHMVSIHKQEDSSLKERS